MNPLSQSERNAVTKAFNQGLCIASAALSDMLGKQVLLSVPRLNIEQRSQAADNLFAQTPSQVICGVSEDFHGSFHGRALLLFPKHNSLELVRLLLQLPEHDAASLGETQQEALVEVGNIILNACLSALAQAVRQDIRSDIPEAIKGTATEILAGQWIEPEQDYVMNLQMHFRIDEVQVDGDIALVMDMTSLQSFRHKLSESFDSHAA